MMQFTLFTIIKKNLRIFFRSKASSISIILIPLLIILLAGFAFNSSGLSNIQIGVHSNSTDNFEENIIKEFEKNNFAIENYPTENDCIDSVKLSKSQLCVSFQGSDNIIFNVDDSRVNLADLLINSVQSSANIEASNIGGILVQNLINTIEEIKISLTSKKDNLEKTLDLTKKNRDFMSDIVILNDDIDLTIIHLENGQNTVNNSNTENKIKESIVILEKIKESNTELSKKISSVEDRESEIIGNIERNIDELEKIIQDLNKGNIISVEKIISPFDINIVPINSNSKKRDNLLPTLLSLIALFGATLLSSTFVMKEKKSRAYFRNFMTPVKDITFIIGTYFTCLIILLLQFLIIFLGIEFILKTSIFSMPLELISALLISFTVFIFIGMFLGYLFRSEETIIFASVIFSIILMFLSNTILPLENISSELMKFAALNPLVISDSLLKKIILFGIGFDNLYNEFIIMGIFSAAFILLTYIFKRSTRRLS